MAIVQWINRNWENASKILHYASSVSNQPKNRACEVMGYQLLRSGTSIGANYREANRAESKADFIHKISIVEKEATETQYWLELLAESSLGESDEISDLIQEAGELLAIVTRIGKTSKARYKS
ncbi:MAG: four helix bundle protein [Anaerolineales bacterium]|nr:four helix bundle protein [Anaerolineales bacterium]